jgi:hypothetical protein
MKKNETKVKEVAIKKERVVNIIGLGASSAMTPDTGENWVICNAYKKVHKADKWFFMDDFHFIDSGDKFIEPIDYHIDNFMRDNPNLDIISKFETELVNKDKDIKLKIKAFPLGRAVKLIPGGYFTSTIAYTIVYALMQEELGFERVDRIRLYGFELWSGSDANEYSIQAPCVNDWLWFAMGKGVKVEAPYYLLQTVKNNQNYYGYNFGEMKYNNGK